MNEGLGYHRNDLLNKDETKISKCTRRRRESGISVGPTDESSALKRIAIASGKEFIAWQEALPALGRLNLATENNLVCIFALCFGLQLYKHVSLTSTVPAYLFGAPLTTITVGTLVDETFNFYHQTFQTGNVTSSFEATLGKHMDSFHCQGLFFQVLRHYITNSCKGKDFKKRKEQLLTKLMQHQGIENPTAEQLQVGRAQIKEFLKPSQKLIDQYAPKFLAGRSAAFTFSDLEKAMNAGKSHTK
ncbi:MAG: hypothetical protein AB3N28_16000 [Kordiimonas sp.]